MIRTWFAIALWKRILVAAICGAIVGWLLPDASHYIAWMGEVFMRLIRMIVVPLVLVTIVAGVASLGNLSKLGSIGARAIAMFAGLTFIAAWTGIAVGSIFKPGIGASIPGAAPAAGMAAKPLSEQLLGIIPTNPFAAVVNGDMLAVIFFAIIVGAGILSAGNAARPIKELLDAASGVMFKIVHGILETAPFGVLALIATAVAKNGSLTFVNISLLALCVVCGSLFVTLVVHGAVVRFLARLSFWRFLTGSVDALLVAFSTGSSSATLPVAIEVSEKKFGIRKSVSSTVLPLGASIGRDGTAMYVALLAIFCAQAFGLTLQPQDYFRIALTTSLVALGTAPVPSASLFMLAAVLSAIGIDDTHTALIVAFILPFDSVFNMIRTVPNATTNLSVATTVARFEGEIDLEAYNQRNAR